MFHHEPVDRYSAAEEIIHSLTHGAGALLSVVGLAALVSIAAATGSVSRVVAAAVFGAALVVMYTVSTLYHSLPWRRLKPVLRFLDHSSIYLLIAGTYTPFVLISLRGPWGWTLFGTIWTLAVVGVAFKLGATGRWRRLSTVFYVAMGWLGVIAIGPLIESVDAAGIVLLVAGGIIYTAGVAFFAWERLPFHHAIWHLFVMTGSALHFFAILLYVLPTPPT